MSKAYKKTQNNKPNPAFASSCRTLLMVWFHRISVYLLLSCVLATILTLFLDALVPINMLLVVSLNGFISLGMSFLGAHPQKQLKKPSEAVWLLNPNQKAWFKNPTEFGQSLHTNAQERDFFLRFFCLTCHQRRPNVDPCCFAGTERFQAIPSAPRPAPVTGKRGSSLRWSYKAIPRLQWVYNALYTSVILLGRCSHTSYFHGGVLFSSKKTGKNTSKQFHDAFHVPWSSLTFLPMFLDTKRRGPGAPELGRRRRQKETWKKAHGSPASLGHRFW